MVLVAVSGVDPALHEDEEALACRLGVADLIALADRQPLPHRPQPEKVELVYPGAPLNEGGWRVAGGGWQRNEGRAAWRSANCQGRRGDCRAGEEDNCGGTHRGAGS